ncbi:MAG: glycerophosphodiester phosphodiesterase [Bacteroidetes bacterium QS_9_68_14]|nr:MAG: glycerophosphodiester phosphodiesterase [Bacteroidetes bacterium QS_9_68_14]
MPFQPEPATPTPAQAPPVFDLQGHRGARGARPENTWPAFRHALRAGAVTLEMDAAVTADSQIVLSHEPWMNPALCRRPNGAAIPEGEGKKHALFEMDYREIARYNCGSLRAPGFPEQRPLAAPKPRLADVLRQAEALAAAMGRPPLFYNIETKTRPAWDGRFHPDPETFTRRLVETIAEADPDGSLTRRAMIQSFDARTLRAARRMGFGGRLALLVGQEREGALPDHVEALGFAPDVYSPHHARVDEATVEEATRRGIEVVPWTVNDPARMRALKALGASGLITDHPARGRFLVEE